MGDGRDTYTRRTHIALITFHVSPFFAITCTFRLNWIGFLRCGMFGRPDNHVALDDLGTRKPASKFVDDDIRGLHACGSLPPALFKLFPLLPQWLKAFKSTVRAPLELRALKRLRSLSNVSLREQLVYKVHRLRYSTIRSSLSSLHYIELSIPLVSQYVP